MIPTDESYADGRAAGDRARFARCKQDIARVVRMPENTPWDVLVATVHGAANDPAAARVASIVAMLRRWAALAPNDHGARGCYIRAADAIERGADLDGAGGGGGG